MIILGLILVLLGVLAGIGILTTLGVILAVVGAVLALLGSTGRAVGGRTPLVLMPAPSTSSARGSLGLRPSSYSRPRLPPQVVEDLVVVEVEHDPADPPGELLGAA